jgi:thiol-disulfide isomerase/thioredoxin
MDYWDTSDGFPCTAIDYASKGSSSYVFDPRMLGLWTWVAVDRSVENCLGFTGAKSVQLVGQEAVAGTIAWHIQVENRYNESLHFWLEVAHPTRVIKHAHGSDVVWSRYDEANPKNPLPTELQMTEFRNGMPRNQRRFSCTSAKLDVPVPAESFTLAGLQMPVGTDVSDNRIHRRIGYWTGTGLSELPSKSGAPQSPPDRTEMLAWLNNDPSTPAAFDAAQWFLLNTPDGPEVDQAAEVILQEHIRSTNLVRLAQEMGRMRHSCSTNLLAAMVAKNPLAEVRGNACFTLATLRKDQAKYGQNQSATADAEKLFARVISDFGQVERNGTTLADLAKPQLSELRRLVIGKPAPETEGEDLEGQPLKLSDYRGKVVVLSFWGACGGCRPEMPSLLKLVERMSGKPFAILGVYCDEDLANAKAIVQDLGMTWPSFQGGRSGPIPTAWNNNSWPTFNVIDAQGLIRYRNLHDGEVAQAVDKLF